MDFVLGETGSLGGFGLAWRDLHFQRFADVAAACQWLTGAHRWTDDKDKVSEDTTAAIQVPGV